MRTNQTVKTTKSTSGAGSSGIGSGIIKKTTTRVISGPNATGNQQGLRHSSRGSRVWKKTILGEKFEYSEKLREKKNYILYVSGMGHEKKQIEEIEEIPKPEPPKEELIEVKEIIDNYGYHETKDVKKKDSKRLTLTHHERLSTPFERTTLKKFSSHTTDPKVRQYTSSSVPKSRFDTESVKKPAMTINTNLTKYNSMTAKQQKSRTVVPPKLFETYKPVKTEYTKTTKTITTEKTGNKPIKQTQITKTKTEISKVNDRRTNQTQIKTQTQNISKYQQPKKDFNKYKRPQPPADLGRNETKTETTQDGEYVVKVTTTKTQIGRGGSVPRSLSAPRNMNEMERPKPKPYFEPLRKQYGFGGPHGPYGPHHMPHGPMGPHGFGGPMPKRPDYERPKTEERKSGASEEKERASSMERPPRFMGPHGPYGMPHGFMGPHHGYMPHGPMPHGPHGFMGPHFSHPVHAPHMEKDYMKPHPRDETQEGRKSTSVPKPRSTFESKTFDVKTKISNKPEEKTIQARRFDAPPHHMPHGPMPQGPHGFTGPHHGYMPHGPMPQGPHAFMGPHHMPHGPMPQGPHGFMGPHHMPHGPFGPHGFMGPHYMPHGPFGPHGFTEPREERRSGSYREERLLTKGDARKDNITGMSQYRFQQTPNKSFNGDNYEYFESKHVVKTGRLNQPLTIHRRRGEKGGYDTSPISPIKKDNRSSSYNKSSYQSQSKNKSQINTQSQIKTQTYSRNDKAGPGSSSKTGIVTTKYTQKTTYQNYRKDQGKAPSGSNEYKTFTQKVITGTGGSGAYTRNKYEMKRTITETGKEGFGYLKGQGKGMAQNKLFDESEFEIVFCPVHGKQLVKKKKFRQFN